MSGQRVVSLYEGFFNGGARVLQTDVAVGLAERGYEQSALSINSHTFREHTTQPMEENRSYQRLTEAGIAIASLNRRSSSSEVSYSPFTQAELSVASSELGGAGMIISVKEQPLRLINQMSDRSIHLPPTVVGIHRSDPENQGRALDELRIATDLGRVTLLVASADSARRAYSAAGIPDNIIRVIKNGVDLNRFEPSAENRARVRNELDIDADVPAIAYVARFDPQKDIPLFLSSARIYLENEPDAAILMCGAGMSEDNQQLQDLIEEAFDGVQGLKKSLRILGIRNDMESIFAAADINASTSRYGETISLSLVEGLSCNAVPVATDVGDTKDIVDEGRGILTPRDPDEIAAAWKRAFDERPEFIEAIASTRDQFGRDRMIDEYKEVVDHYIK